MKSLLIVAMALIAVSTVGNADPIQEYEQRLGFQRRVILQEKNALNQAIKARDNQVHIGKDLLDTLAYGVATGALTYDFLKSTNNVERLRNMLALKNVEKSPLPGAAEVTSAEASSTARAVVVSGSKEAELARTIGSAAYRTTEIASAAILGVLFIGDVYNTGKDLTIRFSDTAEIKAHKAKLAEAEKNLEIADQNLQVAVLANQAE